MNISSLRLSNDEKITLLYNLATMLAAGIPILEVVESLLEDTKGNQKKFLETLHEDIVAGNRIHTTLAKFPRVFSGVTVNLVKASEEAGTLEVTLKDIRQYLQEEMEFFDKVKTALMYPILIGVVFIVIVLTILVVVVPRIATVFGRLRLDIPLPTKILIFVSHGLITYAIPLSFAAAGLAIIIVILYRFNRNIILSLLFSLPLISRLVLQIDLTRFCRNVHLLLEAGLPITQTLELTEKSLMRRDLSRYITQAHQMVVAGKPLSLGLRKNSRVIPNMMIKLIEVGEKSGTLSQAMKDIGSYFDYQVTKQLLAVTALLEPALMVAIGLVVGVVMLSVIGPMYGLISEVGTR